MVADPADLAGMRRPAPSDTANAERVVHIYHVGGRNGVARQNALENAADQNAASGSTVGLERDGRIEHAIGEPLFNASIFTSSLRILRCARRSSRS